MPFNPMTEGVTETIAEHLLLKEETINMLDKAVLDFQDKKINSFQMFAQVLNAWNRAYEDSALKVMIEQELRKRRQAMQQLAPLDIAKHDDPVKKRYHPQYWLGGMPKEFKDKEDVFILDRIKSLREFFVSLGG